jgi:hypothetical protein
MEEITWKLEAYISAAWVDITDDVDPLSGIEWQEGIPSFSPTNLMGSPGWISFTLDNSPANSGGKAGYYTPGHADCRSGFAKNLKLRFTVTYDGDPYVQNVYWLKKISPTAGRFREQTTSCKATDWLDLMTNQPLPPIAVQANKRGDELITTLLAAITTQPTATSLATGDSTFVSAFDADDTSRDSVYSVLAKIARSEFGLVFLSGGTLVFQNRNWRAANLTSLGTISNTMEDVEISDDAEGTADQFSVSITPKRVDTSNVVLAALNYKRYIGPGETVTFTLNYRDPVGGQQISGKDIVDQVADTDYKFGSSEGTTNDLNANLSITRSRTGGNSTDFSVQNTGATGGYLNQFLLRGLGIYPFDRYTVVRGTDGLRVESLDMGYQTNPLVADSVADYGQSVFEDITRRGAVVRYRANNDATLMLAALAGTISSRWTLVETQTALASDWFVNNRKGRISMGGEFHMEWMVVPASSAAVAILGSSALDNDFRLAV